MRKITSVGLSLIMAVFVTSAAQAADVAGIKSSLMTQRENMIAMIGSRDVTVHKDRQAAVAAVTKALDDGLTAVLADAGTTADQAAKLKAFKEIWIAYKTTRDTEVVPLIVAGKNADARLISTGIQAERLQKLVTLLGDLGAK